MCVACGKSGRIPHRVQIAGVKVAVCGSCLGEAHKLLSLSEGDPAETAAAKFLARRLDWWEGEVAGVGVGVCPWHPEHGGVAVSVDVEDVPPRGEWTDLPAADSDAMLEAWANWLLDNGDSGDYKVTDSLLLDDGELGEGSVRKLPSFRSVSPQDWWACSSAV